MSYSTIQVQLFFYNFIKCSFRSLCKNNYGFKIYRKLFSEGVNYEELDAKDPDTLTEEEKVALLGRPRLGDVTKIQIRIKESKEFKVTNFLQTFRLLIKTHIT